MISKITGGCTGHLRQEFRELDLLDEITALKYEGKIPNNVDISGPYRNVLIHKYRKWKGTQHVPQHTHPAIAWSITQPFPLEPIIDNAKWELVKKNKNGNTKNNKTIDLSMYVPATQTTKKSTNQKRKAEEDISEQYPIKKVKSTAQAKSKTLMVSSDTSNSRKRKRSEDQKDLPSKKKSKLINSDINNTSPVGLVWDSQNYSCAYDSLFTILYHIWNSDIMRWSHFFNTTSEPLSMLHNGFDMFHSNQLDIEDARDNVRHYLHEQDGMLFPNGQVGMNITDLASSLCKTSEPICESNYECIDCEISIETTNRFTYFMDLQRSDLHITNTDSVASILARLFHLPTSRKCASCNNTLYKNTSFLNVPELLIVHLPYADVKINTSFKLYDKSYKLQGIVYYGSNHYTSCIVSEDKSIWYHDGIQTGNDMLHVGNLPSSKSTKKWNKYNDKNAVLFVYICT